MRYTLRCRKCGELANIRNGKFGEFYYCPNSTPTDNPGTIGVEVFSKKVDSALKNISIEATSAHEIQQPERFDLFDAVRSQTASFCGGAVRIPTEVEEFALGDSMLIDGDDEFDYLENDPDHWTNIRPW